MHWLVDDKQHFCGCMHSREVQVIPTVALWVKTETAAHQQFKIPAYCARSMCADTRSVGSQFPSLSKAVTVSDGHGGGASNTLRLRASFENVCRLDVMRLDEQVQSSCGGSERRQ